MFQSIESRVLPVGLFFNKGSSVLIVGGGPTGMVAAIALSKFGVPNILIEKHKELNNHPKAHELSSRSLEIFDQLGISLNEIVKESSDFETASRVLFCNTINDEIGRLDLKELGVEDKYRENLSVNYPYFNISQVEIEKILRNYIQKAEHTEFINGCTWVDSKEEAEGITSTAKNTDENYSIKSKFVVCADGAMSPLRNFLGIKMIGPEKIQDFANIYFENDLTPYVKAKAKLYWIFNPHSPGVFIAHHPEKRWVFHIPVNFKHEKKESYTKEVMENKVKVALNLKEDIKIKTSSIKFWTMTANRAETFRKGKFFLVGDAAHRFPPTGGLGMNSGIGDSYNLAWKIYFYLKGYAGVEILDTYEKERKPVIQTNCFESKKNYENILGMLKVFGINMSFANKFENFIYSIFPKRIRNSILKFVKNLAFQKMNKIRQNPKNKNLIKKAILDQLGHFDRINLDLGYFYPNAFYENKNNNPDINHFIPIVEPGFRFPHFELDQNKKTSSHSIINPNKYVLLLGNEDSEWEKIFKASEISSFIDIIFLNQISKNIKDKLEFLKINPDGAILIRPDGQIAWKKGEFQNRSKREEFWQVLEKLNLKTKREK